MLNIKELLKDNYFTKRVSWISFWVLLFPFTGKTCISSRDEQLQNVKNII